MRSLRRLNAIWREHLRGDRICVTVSEWADTYRFLPANATANPGPWRTDAAPYLRGIMDALSVNHPCWKVVFQKANQIGGSETFNNLLGYRIHQFPCPMLLVVPRDKDVGKYVNTRIEPMLEATPALAARIGRSEMGEDASNNQVIKRFPGGQLLISGSGTAAVFRSDPIEVAILDDLDACARNNPEGDIVELAGKRTNTFSDRPRKVVLISTPTIKDNSPIEREFAWSSQNRYRAVSGMRGVSAMRFTRRGASGRRSCIASHGQGVARHRALSQQDAGVRELRPGQAVRVARASALAGRGTRGVQAA